MPIIKITKKDIARYTQPEAGIYLAKLTEATEEVAKDKGSINVWLDFEIISDGPNQGRLVRKNCNSKAPGMVMIPLISAINNIPVDQVHEDDYDTDPLLGKPVGIEVVEKVYDGKVQKEIKSFIAPSAMKAPF